MLSIAELSKATTGASAGDPLAQGLRATHQDYQDHHQLSPQDLLHHHQQEQQPPPHQEQKRQKQPSGPSARPKPAAKPRKAQGATGNFIFVDPISSPNDLTKQRQAVRSIAMRTARKERWWSTKAQDAKKSPKDPQAPETSGSSISSSSSSSSSNSSDAVLDKNGAARVRKRSKALVKPGGVRTPDAPTSSSASSSSALMRRLSTAGSPGPYETMIRNDPNTAFLVNHYINVVSPNRPGLGPIRSSWFQLAQSNTAFLNTLLCMSAMHLYAMGAGPPEHIYTHKANVIAGINANLANPTIATSPANLAAVCNLYCIEMSLQRPPWDACTYLSPHPHEPHVHRNGLRSIVERRGGLDTLTRDRLLYAYILWLQTLENVSDFFFVNQSPPSRSASLKAVGWPAPIYDVGPDDACPLPEHSEVLPIGNELIKFAGDLSSWYRREDTPYDAVDLLIRCCGIQWRLLELLRMDPAQSTADLHESISCVSMLAFALMCTGLVEFNRLVIQDNPAKSKWYSEPKQQVAHALRNILEASTGRNLYFSYDSNLWVHLIGAICAEGSADRAWFVNHCPTLQASITTPQILIHRIKTKVMLWVDREFDDMVFKVWDELQVKEAIARKDVIRLELRKCGGLTEDATIKSIFDDGHTRAA